MERINIASGTPWEPLRGYSRAVKAGDNLFISGTTAMTPNGDVIGGADVYEQTRYVIKVIKEVLSEAGFSISDVVRTRLFVTNIQKWEEYARAHSEAFDAVRPASSIVQVTRLVDPRLLLEMEVDAIKGCELTKSIKLGG
ncbi:MAG: RidA family protein [Deltaproteobacteria bacterium]|nr:RidA family protein [Deltaproteobacteria bacterium]